MEKLYELREKLCKQLKEYPDKDLTSATLDVVDKLAHTIKNLDKVIDKCKENEYEASYGGSHGYNPYPMYNDNYPMRNGGYSAGGRNGRRDSMGRYANGYSRNDSLIMDLTELMEEAPDERTRIEFQKFIKKMQGM